MCGPALRGRDHLIRSRGSRKSLCSLLLACVSSRSASTCSSMVTVKWGIEHSGLFHRERSNSLDYPGQVGASSVWPTGVVHSRSCCVAGERRHRSRQSVLVLSYSWGLASGLDVCGVAG